MFTEEQIERMRAELENPELMRKSIERMEWEMRLEEITRARFAEEGRDFEAEFAAWQKQKAAEKENDGFLPVEFTVAWKKTQPKKHHRKYTKKPAHKTALALALEDAGYKR